MNELSDFFTLFGLARRFEIDAQQLEQAYRGVQAQVHPDRYAHLPETEKRVAMQWASHANEGYRVLRKPLSRARYLLELQGQDVGSESNTRMAPEFLMQQMSWRETVEEARAQADAGQLEQLYAELRRTAAGMHAELARLLDAVGDLPSAAEIVRRLMFIDKLQAEIEESLEALES